MSPIDKVAIVPTVDIENRRRELIKKIEDLSKHLVRQISQNVAPSISYTAGKNWGWCRNESEESPDMDLREEVSLCEKTLNFTGVDNRQRFALIFDIMAFVHEKLTSHSKNKNSKNFYCTRRSYYYELKNKLVGKFVEKQQHVDNAINQICMALDCGPWEIGFTSTSKGLVCGDLRLDLSCGESIVYNKNSSQAVPDIVANVTRVSTTGEFILVIEKDSVFQKLLSEGCAGHHNCIIITGKGYPDVQTRMLLNLLASKLQLPVYALVDPNPHGFEIMCTYRFGPVNQIGFREQLSCPTLRWLGVHPRELDVLGVSRVKLTANDQKKLEQLEKRPYMTQNFLDHLAKMKLGKAEIESINKPTSNFLSRHYIASKLRNQEYV